MNQIYCMWKEIKNVFGLKGILCIAFTYVYAYASYILGIKPDFARWGWKAWLPINMYTLPVLMGMTYALYVTFGVLKYRKIIIWDLVKRISISTMIIILFTVSVANLQKHISPDWGWFYLEGSKEGGGVQEAPGPQEAQRVQKIQKGQGGPGAETKEIRVIKTYKTKMVSKRLQDEKSDNGNIFLYRYVTDTLQVADCILIFIYFMLFGLVVILLIKGFIQKIFFIKTK